jgi:hypothetical protein
MLEMNKPPSGDNAAKQPDRKKVYRAPQLVEYGDLRKITLAKGGMMNDGGSPATRK